MFLYICLQIVYYYTLLYIRPFFCFRSCCSLWFRSCCHPWFREVVSSMVPGGGVIPGSGGGVIPGSGRAVLQGSGRAVLQGSGRAVLQGSGRAVLPGFGRDLLPGAPSAYSQPSAIRGCIDGVQRGGQSRVRIEGVGIVFKMRFL